MAKGKEITKISDLVPDANNYNLGTEFGSGLIAKSIQKNGLGRSLLLDKNGKVIAGNKTLEGTVAAGFNDEDIIVVKTDGKKLVVVQRTDLDLDTRGKEMALADNATAKANLVWDYEALGADFQTNELEAWGVFADESNGGFGDNSLNSEAQEDDFEPPEIETVKTDIVLGDLFEIGPHRLLCGDSTKAEDVERLMGGEKADMVFTDPPYGMSFKGTTFGKDGIENDADDEWEQVLKGAFKNMVSFSKNAVFALCFSPSRLDRFFKCTEGIIFKRILTIYKPNKMGFPWQSWILTSEIIALFENGKPEYIKENYKHDVYTFDYSERPDREVNHPTVKPLSIVYDVISKTKGGSVLDLFLGSGTTMVAAHQLNRRCYGMELSEKYCQIIIDRMLKLDPKIEVKKNGQPYKRMAQ